MLKRTMLLTVLTVGVIAGLNVSAGELTVGEKWIYEHTGARPMSPPDVTFDGERTREVVKIEGEGADKRWLLKEQWGSDDERPVTYYLDARKMISKFEVGDGQMIEYKKPIPEDWSDLKVDEEKTVESSFSFGANDMPLKIVAKRLKDETVKVPAGEFVDCCHVQVTNTMTFSGDQGEMKFSFQYDYWYHEKANGLVKIVFKMDMPDGGGEGQTGTSVLKSHTAK